MAVLLLIELLVLFITSSFIFKSLFMIFYLIFKKRTIAAVFISIIFFPGVVIHELSHLFMAEILQVRTHGVNLIPKLEEGSIKMGSVQVSQTDLIRRFLIGVAPFLVGGTLVGLSVFFLFNEMEKGSFIFVVPLLYAVFVMTNTMFSSKKDLEGAVEALLVVLAVLIAVYGFNPHAYDGVFSFFEIDEVQKTLYNLFLLFLIPVGVNMFFLLMSFTLAKKMKQKQGYV